MAISSTANAIKTSPSILAAEAGRAAYARLSKDKSKRSINVTIQLQEIGGYALDTGAAVPPHLTFSDNDISASSFATKPRDGYQDLLDATRADMVC